MGYAVDKAAAKLSALSRHNDREEERAASLLDHHLQDITVKELLKEASAYCRRHGRDIIRRGPVKLLIND